MNTGKKSRTPYRPRTVDSLIAERLKIAGAIVLEGPRACGKTRTGLESSNTAYFLDTRQTRALIEVAPDLVLQGDPPILLDEWQLDPQLWNEVRRAVDAAADSGQFILTGSSIPDDDITRHTGAGRFVRIRKRRASCLSLQWYMTFWSVWNRLAERCGTTAIRTVRRLTRF